MMMMNWMKSITKKVANLTTLVISLQENGQILCNSDTSIPRAGKMVRFEKTENIGEIYIKVLSCPQIKTRPGMQYWIWKEKETEDHYKK